MKQVLGTLLSVLVLLGGLFFLSRMHRPTAVPEDIVDLLVDAGIELSTSPVEVSLLEHRRIVIATAINAATAQRVVRALLLLDAADGNRPIDLYIRTEGGWVDDAFSIINVMQTLQAPVNTHAIGGTHSSGAMILAAGTGVRHAYPFSSIMFHAGLYEDDGDHGQCTMDNRRLVAFWERHARLPSDWLHTREEKTYFLGPEKALELGLVDQIRTGRPAVEGPPSIVGE
jgi:ATP-dependent Clp endopeptidase proteolytic subunit ClpP